MTELICGKCGLTLVKQKTVFQYMGYEVYEELPRCPACGQVYLGILAGMVCKNDTGNCGADLTWNSGIDYFQRGSHDLVSLKQKDHGAGLYKKGRGNERNR